MLLSKAYQAEIPSCYLVFVLVISPDQQERPVHISDVDVDVDVDGQKSSSSSSSHGEAGFNRAGQQQAVVQKRPKVFFCAVCRRKLKDVDDSEILNHFRSEHEHMLSERCRYCGLGFLREVQKIGHEYTEHTGDPGPNKAVVPADAGDDSGTEGDVDEGSSFIDDREQEFTYVPPKPVKMSKELRQLVQREVEVVSPGEESDQSTAREAVRRKKKSRRHHHHHHHHHHHQKKSNRRRRSTSSNSSQDQSSGTNSSSDGKEESSMPSPARKKKDQRPTPLKSSRQPFSKPRPSLRGEEMPPLRRQQAIRRTLVMDGPDLADLGVENPADRWYSQSDHSETVAHSQHSNQSQPTDQDSLEPGSRSPQSVQSTSARAESVMVGDGSENLATPVNRQSEGEEEEYGSNMEGYLNAFRYWVDDSMESTPNTLTVNTRVDTPVLDYSVLKPIVRELYRKMMGRPGKVAVQLGLLLEHRSQKYNRYYYASSNSNLFGRYLAPLSDDQSFRFLLRLLQNFDYDYHLLGAYPDSQWLFRLIVNLDEAKNDGSGIGIGIDSGSGDNSQEKEQEAEVDQFNFGRCLVRVEKFKTMSPLVSFFASVCVFVKARCKRQSYNRASQDIKTDTKNLISQTAAALNVDSFTSPNGCFNLSLLPELRDFLRLKIEVWGVSSREMVVEPADFENEDLKVDLTLLDNDSFCPIANIHAFTGVYCCRYCKYEFGRPDNLKRHEEKSCPFVRWREVNPDLPDEQFYLDVSKQAHELVFLAGRYKSREMLEQKLDMIGVQLPPNRGPLNKCIMCADIESLLIEAVGVKPADTDKLKYTDRHVPVAISVATDLKGYTRSKCFSATAPYSNFMRAACEYMNEISDVNFKKERKRWRLQLKQLEGMIKIAYKKKRYKFAAEVQNVLNDFSDVLRRMPVYTYNGGAYDLPICSRQGGLVSHFYDLDGKMPTVSVKDKNHWLCLTTVKTKFLDVILMLGRTSTLRSFLQSTGVPSLSSKIWFPFSTLTSFERLSEPMAELPPIDRFYSDLTQSNPLKDEYDKYSTMVDKCHGDSDRALEKLGMDKIPETAEEKHGRLQALCVEKGFKTLGDYLAYYCCLDTVPTVYATQKLRAEFREVTEGLDMCHFSTVSSFSFKFFCNQLAVQAASDRNYLCLLDKEAHGLVKEALVGGLSHSVESIAVVGHTPIRPHTYVECEIVQQISMYDIRSMYSSTMKGLLCSTLGFYTIRKKENGFEAKMLLERSLTAQTFLMFLAKVERQIYIRTQTTLYGEKSFVCKAVKYKVDGTYKIPQSDNKPPKWGVIEINGCEVHGHLGEGGCCDPDGISPVSGRPYHELYAETMDRVEKLKRHADVICLETFWTCQIQKKYKTDPVYRNFAQNFVVRARPDPVIKRTDDWHDIFDLIVADKLHGYVKCDLRVPEHLYEMFEMTLPPFFRKMEIGRKNLDERQRKMAENTNYLQKPTGMLISTYDGENLVLTTTLFKYYVTELDIECTDISLLLQFKNQEDVFAHWFDNTQTKRLHAKQHGLKSLDLACKAILNHSWGFSLTKVEDRKSLSFIKGDKLLEYYKRQGFQGYMPAGNDDDKYKLFEVCLGKTKATQSLPKQVGAEIAINSKIYFSRFIHLLLGKFCDPRKYFIVCLDTDSCALAMSCTEFIDLAKNDECRTEISARMNDFFVPQNEPDKTDLALAPGLWDLECKVDLAISLAPKCYMLLSIQDLVAKFASKGVKKSAENAHVLNFGAFFATLFDLTKEQYTAMIRGLRSGFDSWHYTYEQSKKALTGVNPKWSYCGCGVHHFSHEVYNDEEKFSRLYPIRECGTDYKDIWLHVMGMVKANLGAKKLVLGPEEKIPQELIELGSIPSGSENESDSDNEALDELITLLMDNM